MVDHGRHDRKHIHTNKCQAHYEVVETRSSNQGVCFPNALHSCSNEALCMLHVALFVGHLPREEDVFVGPFPAPTQGWIVTNKTLSGPAGETAGVRYGTEIATVIWWFVSLWPDSDC